MISGTTDDPRAPWGDFRHSGYGCEYGVYSIEAFLGSRAIPPG